MLEFFQTMNEACISIGVAVVVFFIVVALLGIMFGPRGYDG